MGPNFWKNRSPCLLRKVLVNTYKRAQKACSIMVSFKCQLFNKRRSRCRRIKRFIFLKAMASLKFRDKCASACAFASSFQTTHEPAQEEIQFPLEGAWVKRDSLKFRGGWPWQTLQQGMKPDGDWNSSGATNQFPVNCVSCAQDTRGKKSLLRERNP